MKTKAYIRPPIIIVSAILTLLTAINFIFTAFAVIAFIPFIQRFLKEITSGEYMWIVYAAIAFCFIVGLLFLYLAYAIWVGKRWSRAVAFWYFILCIPLGVFILILDEGMDSIVGLILMLVSMVACGVIAYFLRKPEVVELYQKGEKIKFR